MAQNKKKEREGDPTKIKKRETNKVSLWAAHVVGQTRLYFLGKLVKDAENVNLENTNLELSTQAGYTKNTTLKTFQVSVLISIVVYRPPITLAIDLYTRYR